MAKSNRVFTEKYFIDLQQNRNIQQLNNNISSFATSVNTNKAKVDELDTSSSNLNTSFTSHTSTISNLQARLTEIEDNIDTLTSWVAPDIYNMMLLNVNIINVDPNRSGKQNLIDLNKYLSIQGSDTFAVIQPSTSNLEESKKYYVEIEGEYVTNNGVEGVIDLTTYPVRLYKYIRSEAPINTQSSGLTGETVAAHKEKLGIIYGSVNTESGGKNKHYFRSQADVFEDSRRVDSKGVKFIYICTFIADGTLRTESGGTASQTVYAIRLNTMNNAKIFNLQAQMIKLS